MSKHQVQNVNLSELVTILARMKNQGVTHVNINFTINEDEDSVHIEDYKKERDFLKEEATKRAKESEENFQTEKVLTIERLNRMLNA